MNSYHSKVSDDPAASVAYMRDLSIISAKQYSDLERPSQISRFPTDLADSGLEYSGLFEDGWISPEAEVLLHRNTSKQLCNIVLEIPAPLCGPSHNPELTLQLGRAAPTTHRLVPGRNEISVPLPVASGDTLSCHLKFSDRLVLNAPDLRSVAGRILSISLR